jgi:rubrerythrin
MHSLGRMAAIFVAIILVVLLPLQYIAQSQGEVVDGMVHNHVTEFTDTARQQGYITLDMYENLIEEMDYTGELYDIALEVSHPVSGKEIAETTLGDDISDKTLRNTSFNIENIGEGGASLITQSEKTLEGANISKNDRNVLIGGGILTKNPIIDETTYSVGAFSNSISLLSVPTHVHTPDCYVGHNHTASGCSIALTTCGSNSAHLVKTGTELGATYRSASWVCDVCGTVILGANRSMNYPGNRDEVWLKLPGFQGNMQIAYYDTNQPNTSDSMASDYFQLWFYNTTVTNKTFAQLTTDYASLFNYAGIDTNGGYYQNGDNSKYSMLGVSLITFSRSNKKAVNISDYGGYNNIAFSFNPDNSSQYIWDISVKTGTIYEYKATSTGTYISGNPWVKTLVETMMSYQTVNKNGRIGNLNLINTVSPYISNIAALLNLSWVSLPRTCGITVEDTNPICNQVVTSITATNPNQTINKGENIITTAIATYLDGHTGVVNCSSNFNTNVIGQQTVTLTYSGLVGNARTTGIRTCNIQVTVNNPILLSYITAHTPNQEIIVNTTGIYTYATATYTDGSQRTVNCTYSGFNPSLVGLQSVTLSYTEGGITKTTIIQVYVIEAKKLININATPLTQSIERYQNPVFNVVATYDNNTNAVVTNFTYTGFDKTLLGNQNVILSYTEGGITKTVSVSVTVTKLTRTCPVCGTKYEFGLDDIDPGCPVCGTTIVGISASPSYVIINKGSDLPITVTATFRDGRTGILTGWTCDYDREIIGIQDIVVTYQEFQTNITIEIRAYEKVCPICGRTYSLNYDGTDPGCPYCRVEIISIDASPDEITIEKHQALPIAVIGTFRDGHTEIITDWSTDLLADTSGTYSATIYYKSAVDHVLVTVIDEGLVKCPICGLVYAFRDSPNGCPVCSKTIVDIEAYLRNGGTQVYIGSELNLQISVVFRDNHRELTYSGWTVNGYNSNNLGMQTVTVYYEGFSSNLTIEVIKNKNLVTCPVGHVYYLNEDGSDPGCPICASISSREDAIFYFDITYTEDILTKLFADGIYYLNPGDYVTLTIKVKGKSLRSKINTFFKKSTYISGGEVRL